MYSDDVVLRLCLTDEAFDQERASVLPLRCIDGVKEGALVEGVNFLPVRVLDESITDDGVADDL